MTAPNVKWKTRKIKDLSKAGQNAAVAFDETQIMSFHDSRALAAWLCGALFLYHEKPGT
jgi:hypothetical protein